MKSKLFCTSCSVDTPETFQKIYGQSLDLIIFGGLHLVFRWYVARMTLYLHCYEGEFLHACKIGYTCDTRAYCTTTSTNQRPLVDPLLESMVWNIYTCAWHIRAYVSLIVNIYFYHVPSFFSRNEVASVEATFELWINVLLGSGILSSQVLLSSLSFF